MTSTASFSLGRAPGGLPILGHALSLARRPLEFLTSLSAHGDLVEIRVGPRRVFVPCHAEVVWQVMRAPDIFDKGGMFYDKVRQYLGGGIGTCSWSDHRRQRPLVQPAFGHARFADYATVMCGEVTAVTGSWRPGQVIDIRPTMDALFARITGRTMFSLDMGAAAVTEIQASLPVITDGLFYRMVDPTGLGEKLPTSRNRRFEDARMRMRAVIDEVIRHHRDSGADHEDVLSLLMAARDEQTGARLSDDEIHDNLLTFLTGGIETTAATLTWTLHLLSGYPQVESRIHSEASRLSGLSEAPRSDYLRRVLTEVLRLYPIAWIFTREATADTELGGHPIPAGSMIIISPHLLHRDPGLFPEPGVFDPDRWLPDRVTARQRQAFLAFGAGTRKCIGDVFGMNQAAIALAGISARWRLRPTPETRPEIVPRITLIPRSLSMAAEPYA